MGGAGSAAPSLPREVVPDGLDQRFRRRLYRKTPPPAVAKHNGGGPGHPQGIDDLMGKDELDFGNQAYARKVPAEAPKKATQKAITAMKETMQKLSTSRSGFVHPLTLATTLEARRVLRRLTARRMRGRRRGAPARGPWIKVCTGGWRSA